MWNELFTPLEAINLGIGGDKVKNILWRMNIFLSIVELTISDPLLRNILLLAFSA